ncbi:T9SS type A sorting domain-containing protein [Pontibacter sp. SGAir0037]|uniref:T9SS type A sorting domain-containing protein n=1 Tax=Pontibacter sp. SGAir0037 TaxID=2571030 RepID=UPI0010CD0216|nr:T9SS type A sorting domain-containing protein [Pontibacter sp. SGAir0037]QCR21416.1 hypothetical protein C1N53_02995 [Pontibacter sp. SGAir0037]
MKTRFTLRRLYLVFLFFLPGFVLAQTPGLITKPATNGGQAVLDPDGNGYVSKTTAGFPGKNDEGAAYSEIDYRPFPAMGIETLGDLTTGSTGGHTDFAPPEYTNHNGSPVASFFDGRNMLFRFRLGSQSTSSKGYSVLIDIDGQFNGASPNPGFEYEVVLALNFDVAVYRHSATGSLKIFSGSVDQFSQKAVAASTGGGNADFFYDFYVPLTAFGGGITASTPLRMSGITITSAQSGLSGTVADVGGVNFREYGFDPIKAWTDVINAFPPTSLTDIQTGQFGKVSAVAPVVNSPIYERAINITGTSIEAPGSVITVYRTRTTTLNGVTSTTTITLGTTTVSSSGTWTLASGVAGNLLVNDVIHATVTPSNKNTSPVSNRVTVISGVCTSTQPLVITGTITGNPKGFKGTTPYQGSQVITIYKTVGGVTTVFDQQTINAQTATATPGLFEWTFTYSGSKSDDLGLYTATTTPPGYCESQRSNQICYSGSGNNATLNNITPRITGVTYSDGTPAVTNITASTTFVSNKLATISGTLSTSQGGVTIQLVVDGVAVSGITTTSGSSGAWTLNVQSLNLDFGKLLTVRSSVSGSSCSTILSSASNFLVTQPTTSAPTISGSYCGVVAAISGRSVEDPGTIVEIYANGVATGKTGKVTNTGYWYVDLSSLSGGGIAPGVSITARATATGEHISAPSNTVVSNPIPTGTVTINPVTEGQANITGTGPASTATTKNYITVAIEGTPYPEMEISTSGTWALNGISSFEVFAGARITASYRTGSASCPSSPVTVTVTCKAPLRYSIGTGNSSICSGETIKITVPFSEPEVSYVIMNGTTASGPAVIGTGNAIELTSAPLTANATLTVVASKISGTACTTTMDGSRTVTVNALPATTGLTLSQPSISSSCPGSFSATLSGTLSANTYQLVNAAGVLVGTAVQGTGTSASISLSTGLIYASQTFSIRVTNRTTGCFATAGSPAFTVTISSPTVNQTVSPANVTVCMGSTATITLGSTQSGFTYQLMNISNQPVSAAITGNGASQTITTNALTTAGTFQYYVAVKSTNSTCTEAFRLNNQVTINVMGEAFSTSSASWTTRCGHNLSLTLTGNTPPTGGSGRWELTGRINNTTANITIASPTSPTTTATGLSSGTYTFTWTVTSACGTSTTRASSVTVTVNCPGFYELAAPNYVNKYSSGDVLATAFDTDAGVKTAVLPQGQYLPGGVTIDPATGLITVSNPAALVAGTYTFNVNLTDNHGYTTTVPVTLCFYGTAPTVAPLPVELTVFNVSVKSSKPLLQWSTASEINNSHFVIERSSDGYKFSAIGTVKGRGTSLTPSDYNYVDHTPLSGLAYYRLKQVDFDGSYSFSKIEHALLEKTFSMEVSPNPFQEKVILFLPVTMTEALNITVYSVAGKVVYTCIVQPQEQKTELEIRLGSLSKGIYILKATNAGAQFTQRIVKQ